MQTFSVADFIRVFRVLLERTAAMKVKNIRMESLRAAYLPVHLARTVLVMFP